MVLTVTLNPLLERRLLFEKVQSEKVNRTDKEIFKAGGKGINVSRQLNLLNIKNSAFTFLGGSNGKQLRKILSEENIDFNSIATKDESRSAAIIMEKSDNSISTYVGPSSEITDREIEEFKSKLDKMIKNCSVVVLSGSSPCESANGIFPYALELANHYDKISILDTYGEHLKDCLETTPTALHNNLEEIEGSLEIELKSEKEKLEFLDYLYGKNIKLSFLTDGANPGYAAKFDFQYKVESPEIKALDPTGSGDAFVAGIAYGLEKSLVFDEFLRISSALGTANAVTRDTCTVKDNEWKKYYDSIKISPIGKKMKTIDDSPNY